MVFNAMINPYTQIINYDKPDLKEYLAKIGMIDIFKPLLKDFKDVTLFKGTVKFILLSYSIESEVLHSTGISWIMMSKIIYEKAGLPDNDDIFDKVANLKNDSVREAIENWLSFQNNEHFVEYTNARDLRKHCLQQSQSADKTKERVDAMKHAKELRLIMDEAKAGFVENYENLKPPVQALKAKQKTTLGPQDYAT